MITTGPVKGGKMQRMRLVARLFLTLTGLLGVIVCPTSRKATNS